ncbi:pyridoxamine 5'-phosphate oxidase family protein [Actinophytocola glycyrrhizae]|uniref:Pyridoxamine 5'-phosphate oxidase family protein n=1 Tax=Actinophytocola glycyrrhizae TaxID=2044873 RepID=A0ABV9S6W9_9PSEU
MTGSDIARAILDGSSFMTMATSDADGVPWATPVWFATEDHRSLYWVSAPDAQHSRNLAVRPEISVVVYDSTQRPGNVNAVYMTGTAARVDDSAAVEEGIGVFSRVAVREGIGEWGADRVTGDARLRLYRASVAAHYILDPDAPVDRRLRITL